MGAISGPVAQTREEDKQWALKSMIEIASFAQTSNQVVRVARGRTRIALTGAWIRLCMHTSREAARVNLSSKAPLPRDADARRTDYETREANANGGNICRRGKTARDRQNQALQLVRSP